MFKCLTRSEWLRLVEVNFEDGKVYWKPKNKVDQPNERIRNCWNTRWSGKEVVTVSEVKGKKYRTSIINKRGFKLHQLIYFFSWQYTTRQSCY